MKKIIRTWLVYGVQNPGDLNKDGQQKTRAFIALGQGHNPYQVYGILTTTSYEQGKITGELVINDLLKNGKENKLLPNNLVRIYNSQVGNPYRVKNEYVGINSEQRKIIINHFNLQEYKTIREFKFHSLDNVKEVEYDYQAGTLLNGINNNVQNAYSASEKLIDEFNKKYISSDNNIILERQTFEILNKAYEENESNKNELVKLHNKVHQLNRIISKKDEEITKLQNSQKIEVIQDEEMELE